MSSILTILTKERYEIRATNPLRADVVIPMIVSEAKELARKANREAIEVDVQQAAKGYLKKLETTLKAYESLPTSGPLEKVKKEMEEVRTFLPKMKSKEETQDWVTKVVGTKLESAKQISFYLKALPEDHDKAIASEILKGLLG